MSEIPPHQASVLAAVHRVDDRSFVVIAECGVGGRFTVRQNQQFSGSATDAIVGVLEQAGVQLVIQLLGSASTIVRMPGMQAGGMTDPQLAGALELLAESELPSNLPAHRRAAGVLPMVAGGGGGSGTGLSPMVVGWPETGGVAAGAGGRSPWACPVVWCAEIAALAGLGALCGGGAGGGGVQTAVWTDRAQSCAAILVVGQRVMARVLRLTGGAGGGLGAAVAETRKAAGVEGDELPEVSESGLYMNPPPRGVLGSIGLASGGRGSGGVELSEYGLALGAIALYCDASPNVRSLVGLHEREPRRRARVHERAARVLGTPLRAGIVMTACLGLVLAAPIAVAYSKYAGLTERTKSDTTLSQRIDAGEKSLALAKLLREKRWPMTKLVADVAGASPVGVRLDSLELSQDSTSLTLRGEADSADLVTTFREQLSKTKVFSQVTTPSIGGGAAGGGMSGGEGGSVQFQLSAKIAQGAATFVSPPAENFADKPLVVRLYGESGTKAGKRSKAQRGEKNADTSSSAAKSGTKEASRRGERGGKGAQGSGQASVQGSGQGSVQGSGAKSAKPPEIPAALSDEQIAKLDKGKAMIEWAKRKSAAAQRGISEADKQRLLDESEKAKKRMDELKNQPSEKPAGGGGA